MKTRRLGNSDLNVSVIGFGGIPIQGVPDIEATRVVHAALDNGINFFDSARAYTDSETKIGRALTGKRDGVVLATKSMARTAEAMNADLEHSLRNLQTDVIDLYQFHNVAADDVLDQVLGDEGAYRALDDARRAGKVRHIGISSHSQKVMCKALGTGLFASAQLPLNYIETQWLDDAVPAARQAGAGVIAMKPVAGGALGHVPAALRYALTEADVVIPGMDSVAQVEENAAVGQLLEVPSVDEIAALEAEKAHWTGHFCRRCGYCKPCPEGLEIPFLLGLEAYYTRYGLKDWAVDRLGTLKKHYGDCTACGECTSRCPYELPIPELMAKAKDTVV